MYKYQTTPHATTGKSPAELLLGRILRTHLDLLHPDLAHSVEEKKNSQKENHDKSDRERHYQEGEMVYARNYQSGEKWLVYQKL